MAAKLDDEGRRRVEANTGLAMRLARSRHRRAPWIEREDLEGAAIYGLCRAAAEWKGRCPFEPFAIQVIDIELGNEVWRWRWAGGRGIQFDSDGEYLLAVFDPGEGGGPATEALAELSDVCRYVADRVLVHGETLREAAHNVGINRAGAYKALKRAKAHLRARLTHPTPIVA